VKNIQGKREAAAAATQDFRKRGASLLITLGTVPTRIALEATQGSDIPIVYASVGAPEATGLCPAPQAPLRFTGTSMRVPALEQLRFFLMARPGIKRLGILFCSTTPPGVAAGEEAEQVSPELGLIPIKRTVPDDRAESLLEAVTDLLKQRIDALFIPSDAVLDRPKALKTICNLTTRALVPVMVPGGCSLDSGPLLAYHCDFVEMGRQSGRQAARLLKGVPLEKVPPESPDIKKLTINLKAAHDLQLSLSRQFLSQADQFHQ
jgi:putative ABC transport system substrate-binding protein